MTINNRHKIMNTSSIQNGVEQQTMAILVVPFPAQGHLNQLLNLSYRLTKYGFSVHYVGSDFHNRQAKQRLQVRYDQKEMSSSIEFHDLELPHYSSPDPDPNCDPSMQFPSHLQPLFDTTLKLRQPVFELVSKLSQKFTKLIVIHDYFMAYVVQDAKIISNVEIYNFISVSAFATFFHYWENMPQKPFELGSKVINPSMVTTNDGCFTPEFGVFLANQEKLLGSESGFIINTSRVVEGAYVELLEKLSANNDAKTFAIGPFNPIPEIDMAKSCEKARHKCLQWLDKQDKLETESSSSSSSVIFVSFGTTTTMTDEQIKELAIGLERSGQKFVWALRRADKGNEFDNQVNGLVLPEGYEDRVKNRGLVITEWVPQLEILAHPSVGGFMSHCGWNSCLESMSMGVPIAAWPMHSDQPKNAILMTEVLKLGTMVRDWSNRLELVTSMTIENAIRTLLVSEAGRGMTENAQRVGVAIRKSVADGGVSRLEMDSFVARITR